MSRKKKINRFFNIFYFSGKKEKRKTREKKNVMKLIFKKPFSWELFGFFFTLKPIDFITLSMKICDFFSETYLAFFNFQVTSRMYLQALMMKSTHQLSHTVHEKAFSACQFKAPPPEHLSLLWLVRSHMPEPAQSSPGAKLIWHQLCKCVIWWFSVTSQITGIKDGISDEAFRNSVFCGREDLSTCTETC